MLISISDIPKIKHCKSGNFLLIAGPCVIEDEEMPYKIAEAILKISEKFQIPFVFKASYRKANRSKIDAFTGIGDLKGVGIEEFRLSVDKVNKERHLSHIPNIELIKGDFLKTGEEYRKNNKHLLVSLLYLDFDLYEPTKKALDLFLPRMSKGAIVCFDQLNCPNFPGETTALLESFDLKNYKLNRSNIDPWISWIVL